ncbi:MAG: hypothetical protein K6A14_07035 [Erysipelotrichaceae bacterium]|nr:hypothetical protein [Erysipelotrichaceae bacterium]
MNLKNFKLVNALWVSSFIISYPVLKALTSENNRLLIFLDALTITSLVTLVAGIIYHLYLKGDFDATGFFLEQATGKAKVTFDEYCAIKQEKRKDSFNYPLFLSLFFLIISYLAAQLFY